MSSVHCRILILALLLGLLVSWSANAEVQGPWVTTDRTVDCSSHETILKGVLKDGMTDEQKAIALYKFFRQMVYHYQNTPESRDPLKTINVIGNTLCGSQATCMKGLLEAAGIKAHVVSHPGHTFYEAFYDNKWHGYDTMTNFYIMTRGDKPYVASFAELKADPTLISDAKKENRACSNICPCQDDPMAFKDPISINDYTPLKTNWSVKDYALRPGEELVRSWWPMDKPLPGTMNGKDKFPHHTCGGKDSDAEPELFKFWEPYLIRNFGRASRSFRHYFNGLMHYSPDLTNDDCKDGGAVLQGVAPSPQGLTGTGAYSFSVKCPFYITAGVIVFETVCTDEGDSVAASVSQDGNSWTPVVTANQKGTQTSRGVLDGTVVRPTTGLHGYQVKFDLKGKAALKGFFLRTTFQHNAMATPHLMPGKNKVTLAVKNGDALKRSPLTVVYRYKDAPAWTGEVKSIEKSADAAPFTFDADLPESEKLPQMQDLTLRCGKLAWQPAADNRPDKVLADFSDAEQLKTWKSDAGMTLTQDGKGMLIEVAQKAQYPQASKDVLKEDWSTYKTVVVELENVGPKPQDVVVRIRSGGDNKNRTDVGEKAGKGKATLRIPLAGFKQTNLKEVDKFYLLLQDVPEEGCKLRVYKITLEPNREL